MLSLTLLALGAVLPCAALCCIGIVVYNLFFHPYSKYPGPFWAKVTPLYSVWHAYIGDLHIDVLRCHERYGMLLVLATCSRLRQNWLIRPGPVVRYTPDRLVFNTLAGLRGEFPNHGLERADD